MLRGTCQALIYCDYCDSLAWSTFDIALLEDYRDTCKVGDNLESELTKLWKSYLVITFPERDTDAQILERACCRLCGSDVWVRLAFVGGVLERVETIRLDRDILARIDYVSKDIGELFERVTGQSFKRQGYTRSDWAGTFFGAYGGHPVRFAKRRLLRAVASGRAQFEIEGDSGDVWTELLREGARLQLLGRFGVGDEVLTVENQQLGPVRALKPSVHAYACRQSSDELWALRRPESEWCFIDGAQLRALSKSVAVLTHSGTDVVTFVLVGGRRLAIVEELDTGRRRALTPEGEYVLVDGDGESITVTKEPEGIPLSSAVVPWPAAWCSKIAAELVSWALDRPEGWRTPIALEDVYIDSDNGKPVVASVIPSGSREYAAPEYLRGAPQLPAGEVFTICAIVAHLATGEHPFDGGEQGIVSERRRPFYGDPRIARIVDRGLRNDPESRGTLPQLRDDFMELYRNG